MDINTRAIAFDFASTMNIIQKLSLTCTHAGHAYILVIFVTSYEGDDAVGMRKYKTKCYYIWGGRSKGEVEKNYYYTIRAIGKVITVTEAKRKSEYQAFKNIEELIDGVLLNIENSDFVRGKYILMSDGCGAENKNAAAIHGAIACLPSELHVDTGTSWQFACTNAFKGPWDAMGNEPKKDIYRETVKGKNL